MTADIEMPGSDLDIMRDVYMTATQQAAFDRLRAEIVRLRGEVADMQRAAFSVSGAALRAIAPAEAKGDCERCDDGIIARAGLGEIECPHCTPKPAGGDAPHG